MTNLDSWPAEKRRKVRKGTQSCWECKRRKVRCIFASAEHAICNNCRRRGTNCVSQELPDALAVPLTSDHSQVEARLDRVEELLGRARPQASGRSAGKYEGLSRELVAAWPSDTNLEIISALPVGLSIHLYWRVCTPYPGYTHKDPPAPREMLKLPPPGSHPVLIARSLLILGTFLQGVVPSAIQMLGDLGVSYREVMGRAVDRAIKLVTTSDELITTVEGVECVMLEVMYQNYAGNFHLAWMAARRAIAAAQIMGLHRHSSPPASRFLHPATRAAFDADILCFRLVQMDHYLSLMLGLPQTPHESRFSIPKDLQHLDPTDRLERLHCIVSARIMQRGDADINNLYNTRDIDRLLASTATEMPPQWWLVPNFANHENLISDTTRVMIHFSHYHLLTRLHLPYMLRSSSDHRYDHSRLTAVNASREILTRFIVFRSTNPAHFYCRGCDFLAFVATTVMCLAHISSHSEPSESRSVFASLVHSRPSDRGMMERVSEIIDSMAQQSCTDAIAPKLTHVIRHLLNVEANAATGTVYSTSSSNGEGEIDGNVTHEGKALHIHIPYFGTINFEHGSVSKTSQLNLHIPTAPDDFDPQLSFPMIAGAEDDWDLQGIDIALFDSLFRGIDIPDDAAEDTWLSSNVS
ncbi:uncharacterized protein BDV17DRAFT_284958 [Aspergillus undulatus]|uniref:uncharacterized protein n=1 Tax=Aspergillus undulatus TaxID=1810928 RepID=UPI003CCC9FD9